MKKLKNVLPVLVLFLALSFNAFAQAPHFMSYQAVVRNASNNLVVNANVGVKVTILQGSATGTVVFQETHSVMTNANGLATLAIGNGTNISGSIATITWTAGPFFIKTETDPAGGTNYSIVSTTQMMSVPYALFAENSGSSLPGPQGPEGPAGPAGPAGPQGPAGVGMTVNCLECHDHNPATASGLAKAKMNAEKEIEYSKHAEGAELSIEEGTNAGCAPCHSHEGMHSVVDNNTIPTMVLNAGTGKYSFSYNATAAASSALTTMPGKVDCWTCHKGAASDSMALYTTAPVSMSMYPVNGAVAAKTINLTQHGSESNLCVKCHQPRPMTTSATLSNGQSVNYDDLANNPLNVFYDSAVGNAAPNKLIPSYRTHNHYGAVGGVFAGTAGVQFPGSKTYSNSTHATTASCQTCHMAATTGENGGHTFTVSRYSETGAKSWNFKGCNTSGCHSNMSATSTTLTGKQNTTLSLLNQIADKLRSQGVEIMHKNPDYATNIFAHVTPAGYDGYLDIYDPSTNPDGHIRNPGSTSSWTQAQKDVNAALPKLVTLLNVQMGAIINFQLSLREYSLGVHNPAYTDALLNNTLDALTDAGF